MQTGLILDTPRSESNPVEEANVPSQVLVAAGLLISYLVLGLFIEPRGNLSTDVGGKTASVSAMVERNDWDPDIGYWFEGTDPEGRFHPLAYTRRTPNGQWVNTTSLTMVLPAKPLWDLAGPRGALLLPMLGSVTAALAAGALQRRVDPSSNGLSATLLVGLASPATIYAMDFWEHSWGLALMTFGIVAAIDATGTDRLRHVLTAGLLFGIAATMRQEALVYGFVTGAVLVGHRLFRMRVGRATQFGGAFAVAAITPIVAHTIVEQALLGGASRASRGSGTLSEAGSDLSDRLLSGIATTSFAVASWSSLAWVISGALVATMVAAAVTAERPERGLHESARRLMAAAWILLILILSVFGFGFVPGLAIAAPATIFGVVAAFRERLWIPFLLGAAPLPLVLATAFPHGALPQWGGRYLLCTGLVFSVLGLSWLERRAPELRNLVVACCIAITIIGLVWTADRTHGLQSDEVQLTSMTALDDVVVWRNGFMARDMGPTARQRSWLSAPYVEDQRELAVLLRSAEVAEFVWLARPNAPAPDFPGFVLDQPVGSLDFFGFNAERWVQGGR